jgi:hypothetical protein
LYLRVPDAADSCWEAAQMRTPGLLGCRLKVAQARYRLSEVLRRTIDPREGSQSAGQMEWIRDHMRVCLDALPEVLRFARAPGYADKYPTHLDHVLRAQEFATQLHQICQTYLHNHPGPYDRSRFSAWNTDEEEEPS